MASVLPRTGLSASKPSVENLGVSVELAGCIRSPQIYLCPSCIQYSHSQIEVE